MNKRATKQGLVWSAVLVLVGLLALVNLAVELSPWVWAAFLAAAGLGALIPVSYTHLRAHETRR